MEKQLSPEFFLILKTTLNPDVWVDEQQAGATDAQIVEKLNQVWGEKIGFGEFFSAKAGANPRAWDGPESGEAPLQGKALIMKVREILNVGKPTEISETPAPEPEDIFQEEEQQELTLDEPDLVKVVESELDPEPNPELEPETEPELVPEPELETIDLFGSETLNQPDTQGEIQTPMTLSIFKEPLPEGDLRLEGSLTLQEALDIIKNSPKTPQLSEEEEKAVDYIISATKVRTEQQERLGIETDVLIGVLYFEFQGDNRKNRDNKTFKDILVEANFFGKSSTTCYEIGHAFTELQWALEHKDQLGFDPEAAVPYREVWRTLRKRVRGDTPEEITQHKILVLKAAKQIAEDANSKIEDSHIHKAIEQVQGELDKVITKPKRKRQTPTPPTPPTTPTNTEVAAKLQESVKNQGVSEKLLETTTKVDQLNLSLKLQTKAKERLEKENERLQKMVTELSAQNATKPQESPTPTPTNKPNEFVGLLKKPEDSSMSPTEADLRRRLEEKQNEITKLEARIDRLDTDLAQARTVAVGFDEDARMKGKKLTQYETLLNKYRRVAHLRTNIDQLDPRDEAGLQVVMTWRKELNKITDIADAKDEYLAEAKRDDLPQTTELLDKIIDCLVNCGFYGE